MEVTPRRCDIRQVLLATAFVAVFGVGVSRAQGLESPVVGAFSGSGGGVAPAGGQAVRGSALGRPVRRLAAIEPLADHVVREPDFRVTASPGAERPGTSGTDCVQLGAPIVSGNGDPTTGPRSLERGVVDTPPVFAARGDRHGDSQPAGVNGSRLAGPAGVPIARGDRSDHATSDAFAAADWSQQHDYARWRQRQEIAQKVSQSIRSQPSEELSLPPRPDVRSMTAKRLAREAVTILERAEGEQRRGMVAAAKRSADEVLHKIAQANDLLAPELQAAVYLEQAQAALREAEDFLGRFGSVDGQDIARMVDSHQTPVLKSCDVSEMTGPQAADLYLDHARRLFAYVANRNPIATAALRTLADLRRRSATAQAADDAAAISLLRAAFQASPEDAIIANELGYELLQQGLLDEARWTLAKSYQLQPSRAAGMNLVEAFRQSGDLPAARELLAQVQALPQVPVPAAPPIMVLDPQEFASISKPLDRRDRALGDVGRPRPNRSQTPQAARPGGGVPTPAAPVREARRGTFFDRMGDSLRSMMR